jgi:hypothetical protein
MDSSELSITPRPSNNGAHLQSPVNDLIAYLRERELIHSAGPAHMRRLVLAGKRRMVFGSRCERSTCVPIAQRSFS